MMRRPIRLRKLVFVGYMRNRIERSSLSRTRTNSIERIRLHNMCEYK